MKSDAMIWVQRIVAAVFALGLVSLVSSFELIYERPALRFYFDDLKQIIAVSFISSYQTLQRFLTA